LVGSSYPSIGRSPLRRQLPLVTVSDADRTALIQLRDHAPKPYQREWAAAILKLAEGATIQQVAETGLYQARDRHTVADWLNRYLDGGIAALRIRPGRGRKPAFPPSAPRCRNGQDESSPSPDA
jgi:hypothetical protein